MACLQCLYSETNQTIFAMTKQRPNTFPALPQRMQTTNLTTADATPKHANKHTTITCSSRVAASRAVIREGSARLALEGVDEGLRDAAAAAAAVAVAAAAAAAAAASDVPVERWRASFLEPLPTVPGDV